MLNESFLKQYRKSYSEENLWAKLKKFAKSAGVKVIYMVLLLYYTLQQPNVPTWAKTVILGTLGYFILPLDFIPDITPIVGYNDDLGALTMALLMISMYIDENIRSKAKEKLKDWFDNYDDYILVEIDKKIT